MGSKICHVTTVHPYWDTRIFQKECISLAEGGYDVTLLVLDQDDRFEQGVRVIGVEGGFKGRFARVLKAPGLMYRVLSKMEDVDVVHLHDPELLRIAKRLKKLGKRVVYDAHEDLPRQMLGKPYMPAPLKKPLSFLAERYEDRVVRGLDAVVVPTPFIRDRFLCINPRTVEVRNTPKLDELPFQAWEDRQEREICYVGSVTSQRGVDKVVEALEHLEGVTLNLVGPIEPELEEKVKGTKGWERVKIFGPLGREGVREVLARSSVGVVTLRPLVNYLTALPVKMFEYMASGMPVLSSDFELWRKIVEENDCGICVDPLDPLAIADGLRTLMKDPERMKKMGANGREAVEKEYNWDREADRLLALYRELSG
jgi:glycosyltransferase involved in cell wall biosynthesis